MRSKGKTSIKSLGKKRKTSNSPEARNFFLLLCTIPIVALCIIVYAIIQIKSHEASSLEISSSSSASHLRSKTTTSTTSVHKPSKYGIRNDLTTKWKKGGPIHRGGADKVWDLLLEEATAFRKENNNIPLHLMEVGMHAPTQCLAIARHDLQAYCVEPSPKSRERIIAGFEKAPPDTQKHIKFYQMAASNQSNVDLKFASAGGTGDHIGDAINIWEMKKIPQGDLSQSDQGISFVTVKSVAIDDIVSNAIEPTDDYAKKFGNSQKIDKLFAIKIDTQGFEPSVFSGVKKTIEEHNVDYVMTEFWPKGIDFMSDATEKCEKPVEILELLASNGYNLFALRNIGHPSDSNPKEAKHYINDFSHNNIPYHDVRAFCHWLYNVEELFPSKDYHMGYWTDILAVSPNARLAKVPVSEVGHLIEPYVPRGLRS